MGRFLNAYKPERHYMRGPGPKWHAKHTASLVAAAGAQPMESQCPADHGFWADGARLMGWMAPTAAAATLGFMAVMVLA
ncbi:hypothetical protein AUC68_03425 [Methyloceanibacter methanicus]|uniref:Uncharacterized protein n=1 Tax=Methyloceanibacter methanicus TaxID=1774968 RepID=A0A1E3W307_9HYPH|nr:hypothetical protein [Methyloceanibacter methanicus]ODS00171.1 hypothetical protein AUC68_03425 [Methyloceanibacter methanicus]